jgi:hypothetical protein
MVRVPVGAEAVCMDRYEATLTDASDCGGNRYGQEALNDYPPGFPACAASAKCPAGINCVDCVTTEPSASLYACSLPGVRPSRHLTWQQAARACENAGKRLCDTTEWAAACTAEGARALPYGDLWEEGRCNDASTGLITTVQTGSLSGCEGALPGLFDLVGNLYEWLSPCITTCAGAGGSYAVFPGAESLRCGWDMVPASLDDTMEDNGVRCCLSI